MPAATVVAEAADAVEAGLWVDALEQAGINARVFEQSLGGAMGGAVTVFARYPVLVPRDSLGAARNVIADIAGAARIAPYQDPADSRARQSRALRLAGGIALLVVVLGVLSRLLA